MIQKRPDLIEVAHQEAMTRHLEQEKRGGALVEQARSQPPEETEPATVHYTQLQDLPATSPICTEWNTYRRELPRLLEEGMAGKFALIKGEVTIGIFDNFDEAVQVGREKYLMQAFLVQPIREREPLLRIRGHALPWHSSATQSPKAR
jgi:hypothetical protein